MANIHTPLDLVNQAFRNLGEKPITSFTDLTNPRSLLAAQFYVTVRDDMQESHFWNFNTKRVVLLPYSEPAGTLTPGATTGTGITFTTSITGVFGLDAVGKRLVGDGVAGEATIAGLVITTPAATLTPATGALIPGQTGVIFTASAAVLAAGNVGKIIDNLGGPGAARITAFTDTTHVVATILEAWEVVTAMASGAWRLVATDTVTADITSAFSGIGAIAAGSWRLYNQAPSWGFTFSMALPSDYLRIQRVEDSRIYQREGDYVVTDELSLPLTYCALITDVTKWPQAFVRAFSSQLTATFAEQVTGQLQKKDYWVKLADAHLRKAMKNDGQEGSSPQVTASDLVQARRGGHPGWPRRRFPF
jgi:hypothetical protein